MAFPSDPTEGDLYDDGEGVWQYSYALWRYVGRTPTVPFADPDKVDDLANGLSTIPRDAAAIVTNIANTSQTLRLVYFTARKSFTAAKAAVLVGGTAAAATPSLVRFGVYEIAADGSAKLIGATASDTTLLASQNALSEKALAAPVKIVEGKRYAFGFLVVSAQTMPQLAGVNTNAAVAGAAPLLSGTIATQADLPATIAHNGATANAARFYATLTA